jgi:hypothetical protein
MKPRIMTLGPLLRPYSPKCVEEEFCEVRNPQSNAQIIRKQFFWVMRVVPDACYITHIDNLK